MTSTTTRPTVHSYNQLAVSASQARAAQNVDDEYCPPMSSGERYVKSASIGGLATLPIAGAIMTEMVAVELGRSGAGAGVVAATHFAAAANVGSSVALGVGAVMGGGALALGVVALGLCGLVTAGGFYHWAERTEA